uniref:Uncharacterized protein n=1 Tax=Arundo donax TaxID=35708 RepID=A0A0A9C412_ARUDO
MKKGVKRMWIGSGMALVFIEIYLEFFY